VNISKALVSLGVPPHVTSREVQMRTAYRMVLVSIAAALTTSAAAGSVTAQAASRSKPKAAKSERSDAGPKLKWGPAPAVFPRGARMAVVSGDPTKSGPFEVEFSFPNRYKVPPHFHPTDESVTVKSGTFLYAMGDTFDATKLQTMKPGQSGTIAANMHHYAQARGKTVVSVSSTGPFAMTYVNPADDPTNKTAKKK
jgi:quercetin dioxygenase-like cupin family protein